MYWTCCSGYIEGLNGCITYDSVHLRCPIFLSSTFRRLKGGRRLEDCSPCPAGYFCPHSATVNPRVCGAGSYSVRPHLTQSWVTGDPTEPKQIKADSFLSFHKSFDFSIFRLPFLTHMVSSSITHLQCVSVKIHRGIFKMQFFLYIPSFSLLFPLFFCHALFQPLPC